MSEQMSKKDQDIDTCMENILTELNEIEWTLAELSAKSDENLEIVSDLVKNAANARFTLLVLKACINSES